MNSRPLKCLFSSRLCQTCRHKLPPQQTSRRALATATRLRADDTISSITRAFPPSTRSEPAPTSARNLFQSRGDEQAQQRSSGWSGGLTEQFASRGSNSRAPPRTNVDNIFGSTYGAGANDLPSLVPSQHRLEPFVFHIHTHKHNTHICLTGPFPPASERRGPHDRRKAIMMSTGRLGFRKSARSTYDAAFQLAAFVMNAINERDILPMIKNNLLEVRYRGFGKGREAVTKALMGTEGRYLRDTITRVTDATKMKFGGTRSPNPRRLG